VAPLIDMGVIKEPVQFSLIHGVLGGIQQTARNLAHMSSVVPTGSTWGVIAVSRAQWMMAGASASLGGNVRVGFEDNFYLPSGEMATSNGELIAKARQMAEDVGRRAATVAEARELLGVPRREEAVVRDGGGNARARASATGQMSERPGD
jgi:uncharacterized protein (DUF849 family)